MSDKAAVPDIASPAARRAVAYEYATIGYNVAEGVIAITFGLVAGSIALVGFGFDSWIEVAAAAVVLHRLRADIRGGGSTRRRNVVHSGLSPSHSSRSQPT